jgi:hypothetical protein
MKLETFKSIIESLLKLYRDSSNRDKEFQKIFGSDTYLITDWYDEHIMEVLNSLSTELNDKDEFIQWLFWESLLDSKISSFYINEVEYKGTIENVYFMLTNPEKMELL